MSSRSIRLIGAPLLLECLCPRHPERGHLVSGSWRRMDSSASLWGGRRARVAGGGAGPRGVHTKLLGLPAGTAGQFETLCFVRDSRQHCCQGSHNSGILVTWGVFEICCLRSPFLPSKTHTQMLAQAEAPKWPSFSNSGRGAFWTDWRIVGPSDGRSAIEFAPGVYKGLFII